MQAAGKHSERRIKKQFSKEGFVELKRHGRARELYIRNLKSQLQKGTKNVNEMVKEEKRVTYGESRRRTGASFRMPKIYAAVSFFNGHPAEMLIIEPRLRQLSQLMCPKRYRRQKFLRVAMFVTCRCGCMRPRLCCSAPFDIFLGLNLHCPYGSIMGRLLLGSRFG